MNVLTQLISIRNEIMFNFYSALPHIGLTNIVVKDLWTAHIGPVKQDEQLTVMNIVKG